MSRLINRLLLWTARLSSLVSIGILLLFIVGEGCGHLPCTLGHLKYFLFFPLGVISGMVLSWKRELAGSMVTIGSLAAFFVIMYLDRGRFPGGLAWYVFASPAVLFMISALTGKSSRPR